MISVGAFSHLVSVIFAAAVSAEPWDAAVAEMSEAFNESGGRAGQVQCATLMFADGVSRTMAGTLSPEAYASYGAYYGRLDRTMQAVEAGPVGAVRTGAELIAPYTQSEFHTDWLRPNDLEDGLFVRLSNHTKPTSFVVAGPKRSQPFGAAERV